MRRSYALSPSVTSRVPHGSLDVDARLGFRRTRPRSTLQVLPAQRFVDGTPYLYFQEPRKLLFPGAILAHLPLTMLCPPGADVGESMYPIPEGDGFYSSPTPPRFYKANRRNTGRCSGLPLGSFTPVCANGRGSAHKMGYGLSQEERG